MFDYRTTEGCVDIILALVFALFHQYRPIMFKWACHISMSVLLNLFYQLVLFVDLPVYL
jgi:hypothetical protein